MFQKALLAVLLFPFFVLAQGPSSGEFGEHFTLGVTAYQAKDFPQARSAFQKALEINPNNLEAMTNLALVQFQLGEKGWAIALLRKAQQVNPDYSTPKQALEFIVSKLEIKEIPHEIQQWESFRKLILNKVPLHVLHFLSLILTASFGWLLINHFYRKKRAQENHEPTPSIHWVLVFSGFLMLITISLSGLKIWDFQTGRATVVAKKVSVHTAPETDSPVLFELYEGLEVILRRSQPPWVQITYPGGMTGWVQQSTVFHTSGKAPW